MKCLFKIKTTSDYVSLSPNDIRDRIAAGTFPFVNISRGNKPVFRFDVRELDRWIETLPGKKRRRISNDGNK